MSLEKNPFCVATPRGYFSLKLKVCFLSHLDSVIQNSPMGRSGPLRKPGRALFSNQGTKHRSCSDSKQNQADSLLCITRLQIYL